MPTSSGLEADFNGPRGFAGLASLVSVLPEPSRAEGRPSAPRRPAETELNATETSHDERQAKPVPPPRRDPIWIRRPALFWLLLIGLGAVVYLGNVASNRPRTPSSPSYTPTPTYVPPQEQASVPPPPQPYVPPALPVLPPLGEVKPAVGVNPVLSASEIVYCLSESDRLEAMRRIIDDTSQIQINNFNARINDFNARCANYRYRTLDMDRAKITVDSRMSILQTEAAGIVARWR
jgi:hypothetical protein